MMAALRVLVIVGAVASAVLALLAGTMVLLGAQTVNVLGSQIIIVSNPALYFGTLLLLVLITLCSVAAAVCAAIWAPQEWMWNGSQWVRFKS